MSKNAWLIFHPKQDRRMRLDARTNRKKLFALFAIVRRTRSRIVRPMVSALRLKSRRSFIPYLLVSARPVGNVGAMRNGRKNVGDFERTAFR
ncbi:MAG: hypothetical protein HOP19_21485 [Acidobacteria bacterium]|nr:hypothetical protein [Acidobacteriota bacterium]